MPSTVYKMQLAVALLAVALLRDVRAVEYKICVVLNDTETCDQMAADMRNLDNSLKCVYGRDKIDCMKKVVSKEADIVNLAANEAYVAALNFGLAPIVQEERDNKNDGVMYEAVVVVKKSAGIKAMKDLKQKRSCHTGYERNAGWSIPISILRASETMGSECNELAAVSSFFTKSCVPGPWTVDKDLDNELKSKYGNMCELCKSKCLNPADEYLGYEGALKCLTETEAEVAFSKLVTVRAFFNNHPNKNDYEYLCTNGTTLSMDSASCPWASRPNNFVVARANMTDAETATLRTGLLQIFSRFQSMKPSWVAKTIISNNSVTSLSAEQMTIKDILDKHNFRVTIEKPLPKSCVENYVRVCITSNAELEKCKDFKAAVFAQRLRPQVDCHLETSASKCFSAIKDGKADIIAVDSGEVYRANRDYNLIPIMSEIYGKENSSYYAVAVVKATSKFSKLEDLKGQKSCHTGFRRTAGWNIPVGTLKKNNLIKSSGCKSQNGLAKFFSESCVPGVKGQDSLCKLCVGNDQGAHVCESSSEERYSGYSGAFRCLAENAGDVAFVKHTTVEENLGPNRPPWAKDLTKSDYVLFCLDGKTDMVENYKMCNWAQVASHKVVTHGNKNVMELMAIKMLLLKASSTFGPNKDLFKLLGNYHGNKDLLFKDSATSLQVVPSYASIVEVLGKDLYEDLEATYCGETDGVGHFVASTSLLALCLACFFMGRYAW